jgi:hypothetical protein
MVMKSLLKSISPVAALADDGIEGLKGLGVAGALSKALRKARDEGDIEITKNPRNQPVGMAQPAKMAGMAEAPKMMKKGGKVSGKCPRDGIAQRGRTKAGRK